MPCQSADPNDIKMAFAQVHVQWPHDADPDVHLQKRLGSVQHQRASWFVLKEEGAICCSLGAYPVRLFGPVRERSARVLGAVFTPEAHRGRGYAAKLIRWVMDFYAGLGTRDFLLFSDIDTAYYQKLGFHILPSFEWSWTLSTHVEPPSEKLIVLPNHPMNPGSMNCRFGIRRQTEEASWVQAKQLQTLRLSRVVTQSGEATEKWLISRQDGDTYTLLESTLSQEAADWASFVQLVSEDARMAGCKQVKGWWTASAATPDPVVQKEIRPRQKEILMWASQKALADPWLPAIELQGFRAFLSEHV